VPDLFIKWDIRTSSGNLAAMNGKLFNKSAAPPRYTSQGAGPSASTSEDRSAPPPYHLEEVRFPIGGKVPKDSLVTPSQLKTHLGLLRAFRELKTRVTDLEANQDVRNKLPPLARTLEPEERWTWFSELALERWVFCDHCLPNFARFRFRRFHRWVSKLSTLLQPNGTVHNPPLDVWLIWHAYILNPT